MAYYSYSNRFTFYSTGYPDENYGSIPASDTWHDGDDNGSEQQATYYYSDSNSGSNANSSQVHIVIKDKWTAKRLSDNTLEITLDTDIISVCRTHYAGNPAGSHPEWLRTLAISSTLEDSKARNYIKTYPLWATTDYTCKEPVTNIPTRKIYLAPGQETVVKNSVFLHNWTGTADNPDLYYLPPDTDNTWCDSMGCGVAFRNNLPKDFPHKVIFNNNGGRGGPGTVEWRDVNQCTSYTIPTGQDPYSPHWIWQGWNTKADGSGTMYHPGDKITVCEEVELFAIWKYTYRPGMVRHNGIFYSTDRDGETGPLGRCQIRAGGKWIEMRINPDNSGLSDPPCIFQGSWRIMGLIGRDGVPHHIKWDCPHQWN